MRILLVHNYYQQPGGEDVVFQTESALLQAHGHEVVEYTADNQQLAHTAKAVAALETIWSHSSNRQLQQLLQQVKPAVVHFHNTFMRISPSAYYVCQQAGVPVVQTLHNYRLLCPSGAFYRAGHICEECMHQQLPTASVRHACYRQSRSQSAIVAMMLACHHLAGSWQAKVDLYIALTDFAKQKFIEGGLAADRIVVKPNFIFPDKERPSKHDGRYALFVGRLAPEKGVKFLLQSWHEMQGIPLKVVGDGPLAAELHAELAANPQPAVELLGRQSRATIFELMQGASFLLFPSEWYEGFPMTIVEAYACGLPVIAARLGAMAELVGPEETGLHFTPGDAADLAAQVKWAWTHPAQMMAMGNTARARYERDYSAKSNYEQLLSIYERAIARAQVAM